MLLMFHGSWFFLISQLIISKKTQRKNYRPMRRSNKFHFVTLLVTLREAFGSLLKEGSNCSKLFSRSVVPPQRF